MMKRSKARIAAEIEWVAEAQRVVDYCKATGQDSIAWEREVEIRQGIIARENGE